MATSNKPAFGLRESFCLMIILGCAFALLFGAPEHEAGRVKLALPIGMIVAGLIGLAGLWLGKRVAAGPADRDAASTHEP